MNPTKGPWRATAYRQHQYEIESEQQTAQGPKPIHVAFVRMTGLDSDPANLRLLAAAPDLRAALARLADRVEQIELPDGSTPDTLEARALLAKIDGDDDTD